MGAKRQKLKCEACGDTFLHTPSPRGGRPPKLCPKDRKKRGEVRDVSGVARRKKSRRAAKAAAREQQVRAHDEISVAELAAALSMNPDPVSAARLIGLAADGPQLEELVALARDRYAGIVEGDPSELGRRINGALHLFVMATIEQRKDIAPRDLPHVARALSQVHTAMVGDKTPRVAQLTMMVVGADGKPFDPNAQAQPQPPASEPPT